MSGKRNEVVGVVTEKERREDDILKNCIQEAYGCSDEDILAELDEIEASLTDDDFPGVEERLFERLMVREAEEERKLQIIDGDKECGRIDETRTENERNADTTVESEISAAAVLEEKVSEDEISMGETPTKTDKVAVRFGKKKLLLVGVLAAAFVTVLGGTVIGESEYVFRESGRKEDVIFDSGLNRQDINSLEMAYQEIKEEFGNVLCLGYLPDGMEFNQLMLNAERAILEFKYDDIYMYIVQYQKNSESSINLNSDRMEESYVENKWLGKVVEYQENILENAEIEREAKIEMEDMIGLIFGKINKEEFEKILKEIYFN